MSEFCLCSISCEFICGFPSNFVYALILTRCRFGWLNDSFRSFSIELWPLIDVEISFMLNILCTNSWILIKICKCIDINNVGKNNYKLFFVNFQLSYGPWLMSEFCFHLIPWEQIDGFWWNFEYAVLWLTHEIFPNFSIQLWPLIDVRISIFLSIIRDIKWILINEKKMFMHWYTLSGYGRVPQTGWQQIEKYFGLK